MCMLVRQDPNVKLIRELRAENARLRALLGDAVVRTKHCYLNVSLQVLNLLVFVMRYEYEIYVLNVNTGAVFRLKFLLRLITPQRQTNKAQNV